MRLSLVLGLTLAVAGCGGQDDAGIPAPPGEADVASDVASDVAFNVDSGPTTDEGAGGADAGPAPTDDVPASPDDGPPATDEGRPPGDSGVAPDPQCERQPEGAPCDADQDACTVDECNAEHQCVATGETDECAAEQAALPCWTWLCNGKSGCQKGAFLAGGSCDDKAACTKDDTCVLGAFDQELCVGTPFDVDDENPCTDDSCTDGVVDHVPLDGTSCGAGKLCDQGVCKDQSPACPSCAECETCDEGAGACVPLPGGTGCSDDGNACTTDACQGGVCTHPPVSNGTSCGSGKYCQGGACVDVPAPAACDIAWAEGPASGAKLHHGPVSLVVGGRFHLIGGSPSKTHQIFDPVQIKWSEGAAPPEGVGEGTGAVVGGNLFLLDEENEDGILRFDPSDGKWSIGAPRPTADGRGAAAGTNGTHLFAVGGGDGNLNGHSLVHRYDPTKDEWSDAASMPTARGFIAYTQIGDILYALGGRDKNLSPSIQDANESYNTKTDTWATHAPLPIARNSAAATHIGTAVYITGGFSGSKKMSNVDRYDPATNTWTECTPLPKAVSQHAVAAHGGKLYFMGGGTDPTTLWIGTVSGD